MYTQENYKKPVQIPKKSREKSAIYGIARKTFLAFKVRCPVYLNPSVAIVQELNDSFRKSLNSSTLIDYPGSNIDSLFIGKTRARCDSTVTTIR